MVLPIALARIMMVAPVLAAQNEISLRRQLGECNIGGEKPASKATC